MIYSYLPFSGLLCVEFDIPLTHAQRIVDENFVGRDLVLTHTTEGAYWKRLECTMEEWDGYLQKAIVGALAARDFWSVMWAMSELTLFRNWCAVLSQTAFYKPLAGVQA